MAFVEFRSLNSKADHLVNWGFGIFQFTGIWTQAKFFTRITLSLP